jgi:DNA polymerase-4
VLALHILKTPPILLIVPVTDRKCPELIFVKPRFEVYKEVSQQIRAIFAEYTPMMEPLSLDEAYLDVSKICEE